MRKQYLHLSAFSCDKCNGPVVAGSLAVRENEIERETDIRQVGTICLACGHRQDKATDPALTRHFSPVEWELVNTIDAHHLTTAYVEALNRACDRNRWEANNPQGFARDSGSGHRRPLRQ
jgi:hypothetical protein